MIGRFINWLNPAYVAPVALVGLTLLALAWPQPTPGIHLCWDPNTESDLLGYWVMSARRYIVAYVECPCPQPGDPDYGRPCLIRYDCPVYNDFVWEYTFTGYVTEFQRNDCANEPNSLCIFKWPMAQDFAFNMSAQPMIGPTFRWEGICP